MVLNISFVVNISFSAMQGRIYLLRIFSQLRACFLFHTSVYREKLDSFKAGPDLFHLNRDVSTLLMRTGFTGQAVSRGYTQARWFYD